MLAASDSCVRPCEGPVATPDTASPELPSGVSFSAKTEAIGGTPSIEFAKKSFTITATGSANSPQTASYTINIQVSPSAKASQVSITVGSGVTEGGDATFTVTASPASSSPLSVSVSVTQQGDFGAATGSRTVTIPRQQQRKRDRLDHERRRG